MIYSDSSTHSTNRYYYIRHIHNIKIIQ